MKLVVNGEEGTFGDGLTVSELLVEQKVKMPEMVSVVVNGETLKSLEFEGKALREGDNVEFLYFMGGGAQH